MNNSPWQPVLVGDAAEHAWTTIKQIAQDLEEVEVNAGASLDSGYSGLALFYAYLAAASGNDEHWSDVSQKYLERALTLRSSSLHAAGLWQGHAGVGWTVEHLAAQTDDLNAGLDKAILECLTEMKWGGEYDLISGLVGIAVYSIERLPRPEAQAALRIIVRHLSELAKGTECGLSWWTEADSPLNQKDRTPDGHFNLGVAHGVPAVVNVLSRLVSLSIEVEETRRLLYGGARWLLEQCRRSPDGVPYWVVSPEIRGEVARTAWCYGGLGIAAVLFGAGQLLGEDTWIQNALALAESAAAKPPAKTGVVDAGICHGAFGVAHIFSRLYNATYSSLFRDAAVRWIADGMSHRRPVEGVADFPSYDPRTGLYSSDPGLLGGACGVGLVLISAVSDVRPAWDRVLLLDMERSLAADAAP